MLSLQRKLEVKFLPIAFFVVLDEGELSRGLLGLHSVVAHVGHVEALLELHLPTRDFCDIPGTSLARI